MERRTFTIALSMLGSVFVSYGQTVEQRPNIVFLLADDLRYDAVGYIGKTLVETPNLDKLATDGTIFTRMYATSAISCCSRAGIFTGMYSRSNGIVDFSGTLEGETLANTYPMLMKNNGYTVGFIGKYGVGDYLPETEFDYWRGFSGQGTYIQTDKEGKKIHLTALISTQIDEFLEQQNDTIPFCLSVSFKSPHTESDRKPFLYDKKYQDMYETYVFDKPETFGEDEYMKFPEAFRREEDGTENEGYIRFRNRFGTEDKYQASVKGYYRLIAGIDEAIGRLRNKLQELRLARNTMIVFTSDNGYYLGEHGLEGKWYGHEESIRLPLVIYVPQCRYDKKEVDDLALNIDLAPTLLEYAGVDIPAQMQGKSLRPCIENKKVNWRSDFLYEHLMNLDKTGWYVYIPQTEGVVTERYKYMRYFKNNDSACLLYEELFDVIADPLEKNNLIHQNTEVVARMRRRLEELIVETK